jgi:hypothetical protein
VYVTGAGDIEAAQGKAGATEQNEGHAQGA